VQFDGVPQTLQIVAIDGVPTGSQDGGGQGEIVDATDILVPTAGRAEFIVSAPPSTVSNASLITLAVNTGPDGDNDPQRTLATIQTISGAAGAQGRVAGAIGPKWNQRFAGLAAAQPSATRSLYFSENDSQTEFFITVDGATPTVFNQNNPPAIVTTQGSVEDWTIENRSLENHIFHIHQIHFLMLSQNNFETNGSQPDQSIQGQYLDTIQIPFWDGDPAHPFPSVTVRMDFRGSDIGDFVYHCHIAGHEDAGMMAIIRVMPSAVAAAIEKARIRLVSLGLFGAPDAAQEQKLAAWCIKGRPARRRRSPQRGGVTPARWGGGG
jgi:FtsP/CotA-like multicopper oxidase with cupredoxin domain